MADDIIRPSFGGKPKPHMTGTRKRADNLLTPKRGTKITDALHALGFGRELPHSRETADAKERRELRQRADSMAEAAASIEIAARLLRTEAETLSRRLAEKGGNGPDEPKGAA